MAAPEDIDEKFDASEPSIPSVSEANAELRRISAVRTEEALEKIRALALQLRSDIDTFHRETRERYERDMARIAMLSMQLDNWIGHFEEEMKGRK